VTLAPFVRTIVDALGAAGIPAMLTGSLAAAYHGAQRSTMDVDLVIDPSPAALDCFTAALENAGFYVSADTARAALVTRGMFNVIDPSSGWKADLIVRKSRPFSVSEFERRQPGEFLGTLLFVARVEDLIVAKLEWATMGASARQMEDVRLILAREATEIDVAYIDRWVNALGLQEAWAAVRSRPGENADT
jgi:hypothetical protein